MNSKNKLHPSFLAAALCALALASPSSWALDAGANAPELNLPGVKDAVNLSALKGKVVYVDFWASWCGPCRQSFPFMNELQAKYRAQGLEIVAINLDAKRADADQFLTQTPAQFTVAFDAKSDSAKRFEVKGMPYSYVIGRDGKVIATHNGFNLDDRKALEAHIASALNAK
jgi:cytochrome c biogenesis protein CcmG, thiol:disulfide interchange protein DsbE